MTIYSINRDQSASYIKHNLSYGDRIDNVLVITVIAEFTNEIPKLKETFIFDEREGQVDIDKIVSMVIHDYVSAWFWKKDWDAYNGVDGKPFNSRGVFEYYRMHNYRSFMSVNMVRNEVKGSVDIHTLKTGDLLVDGEGDIHRVHAITKESIIIAYDYFSRYTVYDLNTGPVIDHLIKQFPGLTNGEAK